jgi:hypothetical protein
MDERTQPTTQQVEEAANLDAFYTNFARVTRAPEELVLDFGINLQSPGSASHPVKIERRLVMNYYTAKRLLGVLGMAVQGYEQTFGALEIDVNKRAQIQTR